MTAAQGCVKELEQARKLFNATTSVFEEEDASYQPNPELYTVAGQIAHTADSVDWFIEGAFGAGWNMDFDAHIAKARAVPSLAEAREWLERAFANAIEVVGGSSDADLYAPIPDTRIMAGAPRIVVMSGITDHTAHHRGSLAVYARLLGKVPPMPYS